MLSCLLELVSLDFTTFFGGTFGCLGGGGALITLARVAIVIKDIEYKKKTSRK